MCGIAGFLNAPGRGLPEGAIEAMSGVLLHRGPDAGETFSDAESGLALGHRRLAIVDLSPNGAQPMHAKNGRYIIVLNGEIYNFQDLRAMLEAEGMRGWRGHSDTEVLLAAIESWGVETALARCDGMFAFALWDRKARELVLARDRMGEKPLFYAVTDDGIAFASQLGSVLAYPHQPRQRDEGALEQFLALSYLPEPRTPFAHIAKLPAGCWARIRRGDRAVTPVPYWSALETAIEARISARRQGIGAAETVAAIEARLTQVVARQMVADVPLGAFLSGGLDSSLVVALMQQQSPRPVKTFTIGFEEQAYDESPFARAVAAHLKTDHAEVIFTPGTVRDMLTRMPEIYDEPFADSSQLPTYLVSMAARKSVTVALTGDGGDEIFGGYNRHLVAARFGGLIQSVPALARRGAGLALTALGRSPLPGLIEKLQSAAGASRRIRLIGEKLVKLGGLLAARDALMMYEALIRRDDGLVACSAVSAETLGHYERLRAEGFELAEIMMLLDTLGYLPGDPLTKVDRASMAVSLETRVPFLDHQLFALAWRLPLGDRIRNGASKAVIRDMLARHVPAALFERPKAGFGVPISSWLAGPLRPWVDERLAGFSARYPRFAPVVQVADARFRQGDPAIHHLIWNICMWQSWEMQQAA